MSAGDTDQAFRRIAQRIMDNYPEVPAFHERKVTVIWASRHQPCPKCGSPPYTECMNLTERRKGRFKVTSWPHDERVDWGRLVSTLREKGYRLYR